MNSRALKLSITDQDIALAALSTIVRGQVTGCPVWRAVDRRLGSSWKVLVREHLIEAQDPDGAWWYAETPPSIHAACQRFDSKQAVRPFKAKIVLQKIGHVSVDSMKEAA